MRRNQRFWILLLCGLTAVLATMTLADSTNRAHLEHEPEHMRLWYGIEEVAPNLVTDVLEGWNSTSRGTARVLQSCDAGLTDFGTIDCIYLVPPFTTIIQFGCHTTIVAGMAATDELVVSIHEYPVDGGVITVVAGTEIQWQDGDEVGLRCTDGSGEPTLAACDTPLSIALASTTRAITVHDTALTDAGTDGVIESLCFIDIEYPRLVSFGS